MASRRPIARQLLQPLLLLALAVAALLLLSAAEAEAMRLQHMHLLRTQPPSSFSSIIPGNLRDSIDPDSPRYRRWLKLVRLGWEGGEAARALAVEGGDEDRAHVRLAEKHSGFEGLRCLSKGNCFNDPRRTVFSPPPPLSAPVRPPPMQEPPPPQSDAERARDEALRAERAAKLGVDMSAELLAQHEQQQRQQFEEQAPPTLSPYELASPHTPAEDSPVRQTPLRAEFDPSQQKQQFSSLMRSWLTTISAPFHSRKPGSVHDSEPLPSVLPGDTHPGIVPAHSTVQRSVTQGGDARFELRTEWHQPPHYESRTLEQLKREREQPQRDAELYARNRQALRLGRDLKPAPPAAPPAPALSPAQKADQELIRQALLRLKKQ